MDATSSNQPAEPPELAELFGLVAQAQAGDPTVLPRIRQILEEHPEVWHHCGDVSGLAERAWLALSSAGNPLVMESKKLTIAEMKADLLSEGSTQLERMLVDQIIVSWLEYSCLQTMAAAPGPGSVQQGALNLRRLESAEKRYNNAVKRFMDVRTLMPAAVKATERPKLYEPPGQVRA